MKKLPNNLQNLKMILYENDLGENYENMIYLAQGLNKLPNNLKTLNLNLSLNKLGKVKENIIYLGKGMK